MRYAFYSHGGCQNHGCEAIVKTTSSMIKARDKSAVIKLYTFRKDEDEIADIPCVDEIEEFIYNRPPENVSKIDRLRLALYSRISQEKADNYFYSISCRNPSLKENDVYISVGGDNYCYGDGKVSAVFNNSLRKMGKKTVLWGCSVDNENMTAGKLEDLRAFDLIVARETLTYSLLQENGINCILRPDPAFTLETDKTAEQLFKVEPNTLGLNISDLVNTSYGKEGAALQAALDLIKFTLSSTDMNVLLIPHVTRGGKCDCEVLGELAKHFEDEKRVRLADGSLTASQYKSIISRCEAFVGARTHATIAAYSTCVPTLVLGYSVKSKGIAQDIFGTDEGLVIPVSALENPQVLIDAFADFLKHSGEYKKHLQAFMPDYIKKAYSASDDLINSVK